MTLEKILRIDEIRQPLMEQGIIIKKTNLGINIINSSNLAITIHKKTKADINDREKIYIDCPLSTGYGLPEFKREWEEADDIISYIMNICVPYFKNLKGARSISKEDSLRFINNFLNKNKIEYSFFESGELSFIRVNSLGKIYIENLCYPNFQIVKNESKFGWFLHNSFIELVVFKNIFENTVIVDYPWFSFCPVTTGGEEYVNSTLENFLKFMNQKIY